MECFNMVLQTTLCCRFIFTFISKTEKISNQTLKGEKIAKDLKTIYLTAKKKKKENIFQVLKKNDFLCGFKSTKFDIFDKKKEIQTLNIDEKIKILIATETDPETKHEVYTYYQNHKTEKSFNKEKFLEELLVKNYYFL